MHVKLQHSYVIWIGWFYDYPVYSKLYPCYYLSDGMSCWKDLIELEIHTVTVIKVECDAALVLHQLQSWTLEHFNIKANYYFLDYNDENIFGYIEVGITINWDSMIRWESIR